MPLFILENRLQELIFKNFRFPRKFLKFGKKKKRWGIKMTEVTSGGSPPPEERRERRVGRGVSKVMDANPDRGGRVRRNATRGERCVGVGGGERRRPDIADLAVYHLRRPRERLAGLYLALLLPPATDPRGRGPRPNPGHCSHRFNRYSLSALGSFPKTPGRVSSPDAPIPGSSCALPLLPHLTPLFPSPFPSSHGGEGDG